MRRFLLALVATGLVASCVRPAQRAWYEGGEQRGWALRHPAGYGLTVDRFADLRGRTQRVELLDSAGGPATPRLVAECRYDERERLESIRYASADGHDATGWANFAVAHVTYAGDEADERYIDLARQATARRDGVARVVTKPIAPRVGDRAWERVYQNARAEPTTTCGGYARIRIEESRDEVVEIRLVDANATRLVPGTVRGARTSVLRYDYLSGIPPANSGLLAVDRFVAEHLLDPSGNTLETRYYYVFPGLPDEDCR